MEKSFIVPFRFKGVHSCQTVVLSCIDFRFWREAVEFCDELLETKNYDFPSLPGAAKAINESQKDDISLQCISVPFELHDANRIVIINHEDCGAYGGSARFNNPAEEQKFHEKELRQAKEKILNIFPDKEVMLAYARLIGNQKNVECILIK